MIEVTPDGVSAASCPLKCQGCLDPYHVHVHVQVHVNDDVNDNDNVNVNVNVSVSEPASPSTRGLRGPVPTEGQTVPFLCVEVLVGERSLNPRQELGSRRIDGKPLARFDQRGLRLDALPGHEERVHAQHPRRGAHLRSAPAL